MSMSFTNNRLLISEQSDIVQTNMEVSKMSYGYSRPPRKMYKITCEDCGEEAEVPFKPTEGRPVYCRDCYQKHKKY